MPATLRFLVAAATLCASFTSAVPPPKAYGNGKFPQVDLGYEIHQASYFNETGGFYNFTNIRFAAPRKCNYL